MQRDKLQRYLVLVSTTAMALVKARHGRMDHGRWFRAGPDGIIPDEFRLGIDRLVIRYIHGRPEPQLIWRGKPYGH